jgi:hypothetical protein
MSVPSEAGASLQWLISPVGRDVFFSEYWERQTLVVKRGQPDYFHGLLSLDEVDRALTTLDLRYPNVVLKNAARKVTADDYTVGGDALDVARVYQLFEEGSTITLAFLDTVIPALAAFCRALESEFSSPFQTNIYLTPARAQGARHHYCRSPARSTGPFTARRSSPRSPSRSSIPTGTSAASPPCSSRSSREM